MAYIYQADIYCDDCGMKLCEELPKPADPDNEASYDSDDYPKYCRNDEESDTVHHCANNETCINAIELPMPYGKVGCMIGNQLTCYGVDCLKAYISADPNSPVIALWQEQYSDYLED